jgi:hypothetical protein
VKLLNFIGLLFSVARLLWRALCFAWNHGGQLRDLTDELRKVVTDDQLAVRGVTLGTATLKVVNANSVPVQALTDQARELLETDLPGTALAAAGTALDATEAQRVELNKLVLALQRVLAKPALVEKSLAVANRTLAVADTQDSQVTDLLRALEHVLSQQPLAASTLPVMTKALDIMTTSLTTPTWIAINSRLLALLSTPLPAISLGLSEKALKVAEDNQATLVQTIAILTDLLGRPTPGKSLELIMNALREARQNETPLLDTIEELTTLLNTPLPGPALMLAAKSLQIAAANEPSVRHTVEEFVSVLATPGRPVPDTFTLAEKGANVFWTRSEALLTLLEKTPDLLKQAGPALVAAGNGAVLTSYALNGAGAVNGTTGIGEPAAPAANSDLDTYNLRRVIDAASGLLTGASTSLATVATVLNGLQVPVPTGIAGDDTGHHLSVGVDPLGPDPGFSFDVYERYTVSKGEVDLLPNDLTAPAEPAITAVTTGVEKVRVALNTVSQQLFRDGVAMIEVGDALNQVATKF